MPGVSDLVRRACQAHPDRTAIVDCDVRLSWRELDAAASRAANAFGAAGVSPGDRLALQLPTSADFVVLYLAALRAGAVVVPVNPAYTVPELSYQLRDSGARMLVTSTISAIEAAPSLPVERVVVTAGSGPPPAQTLAELLAGADGPDPGLDRGGEELAVLIYTSGTGGQPKGAMLSARAMLANLDQLAAVAPALIAADDVAFVPLPLFHVYGLNAGLGMALRAGATTVLNDRFDAETTLQLMRRERVTVVVGAPGMFAAWLGLPGFADGFDSMRTALSGSAPLAPALVSAYARRGITLREGYGLTEAAPVVTLNTGRPKPGSVGRPLPGVEVYLRDADGEPVADEQDPGQLLVRGPNLFSGYWPDGARGPDPHGWFATGDIAVADQDGDLVLVGRTNDLVLVNGFNVYPAEVETVLGAQPGIAEVAVVGVDDPDTGEAVVAYVVPAPGVELNPSDVITSASRSLARFKLPRRVEIVDEIPHTVTGKVMKWRLGTKAADGNR
jgi:long-chain acyl-CoA synthetase